MDLLVSIVLQIVYVIANLALISLGLAIIFGMMRVINLAHGEFLMLGGYTVVVATNNGVNIWVAILILSPLVVGIIGVIVERLLIRFLYGRMVDTLLATWGLSLLFIGLVTSIFGASTATTISPPLGVITIGEYTSSGYELFLIGITIVLLLAVFLVLKLTTLGLVARGTMQNAEMASALGVSTSRIYMLTFGLVPPCQDWPEACWRRLPECCRQLVPSILPRLSSRLSPAEWQFSPARHPPQFCLEA